jgi:MFS family permease
METKNSTNRRASGFRQSLRALEHKNFRLFFGGQSISLIGTWMQRIAMGWLVYRLTNSPFLLGVVGFSTQIPTFVLAPFAGVLADRWNRLRILVVTQILAMIQALVLSVLVLTGTVAIWQIIILSLFLGTVNAFDTPTRQSFLVEMVEEKRDLSNAIALNSSIVNSARLLGPSIAGLLIGAMGEGMCFLLNGISYLAVIAALLRMRVKPNRSTSQGKKVWAGLKEGFSYAFGFSPIRAVLLLLALVSLMGMPYTVLMPVFARDSLHGGPYVLGFLMGASGVGALGGAIYLASRKSVLGLGRLIPLASALFGVGLIAFSHSRFLPLSLVLMLLIGFGMIVEMAASNTVLQTIVDDDKRGRVMSFYAMSFMGMVPFGSLLSGFLASKIGSPDTLLVGGLACIAGAAAFALKLPALRERARPTYVRMGIVPEVMTGIQSASELTRPDEKSL